MKNKIPELDVLLEGINDPNLSIGDNAPAGQNNEGKEMPEAEKNVPEQNNEEDKPQNTKANDTNVPIAPSFPPKEAEASAISPSPGREACWLCFLGNTETAKKRMEMDDRVVVKLDRDLADSLDDLDIQGRCRTDLVNDIVRAFVVTYLPQLMSYRKATKTLFENYKTTKP